MAETSGLVVIPTYNEAATIQSAVRRVLESSMLDVLVVDDNSPDGTAGLVNEIEGDGTRVHLLKQMKKGGLGRAYVAGFTWGLERGYARFIEMDADLSHDPTKAADLIAATDRCDLVIGSRYVNGGAVRGWSKSRYALSKAGNLYVRAALGLPVRDSTSGFRCYRREVLNHIDLGGIRSQGYAFQVEMAYRAWRLGFRLLEVPIVFTERRAGASKMAGRIVAEALFSVALWGLRDLVAGRRFSSPTSRGEALREAAEDPDE